MTKNEENNELHKELTLVGAKILRGYFKLTLVVAGRSEICGKFK